MDKETILDRLKRAYEMEEEMAGMLIGLCEKDTSMVSFLPKDNARQIANILLAVKSDTESHKKIVSEIQKVINER